MIDLLRRPLSRLADRDQRTEYKPGLPRADCKLATRLQYRKRQLRPFLATYSELKKTHGWRPANAGVRSQARLTAASSDIKSNRADADRTCTAGRVAVPGVEHFSQQDAPYISPKRKTYYPYS